MVPILLAVDASGVFASWQSSILGVIKPAGLMVSVVGIGVLAVLLVIEIMKAVAAHRTGNGEFQTHIMWIIAILAGIALLATFSSWGAGFFGG